MHAKHVITRALRRGSREYFGKALDMTHEAAEMLADRVVEKLEKYGHLHDESNDFLREGA